MRTLLSICNSIFVSNLQFYYFLLVVRCEHANVTAYSELGRSDSKLYYSCGQPDFTYIHICRWRCMLKCRCRNIWASDERVSIMEFNIITNMCECATRDHCHLFAIRPSAYNLRTLTNCMNLNSGSVHFLFWQRTNLFKYTNILIMACACA